MRTLISSGFVAYAVDDYSEDIFIDGETFAMVGRFPSWKLGLQLTKEKI